eukprot:11984654-Alexandrium_andersonii.AAC.1
MSLRVKRCLGLSTAAGHALKEGLPPLANRNGVPATKALPLAHPACLVQNSPSARAAPVDV